MILLKLICITALGLVAYSYLLYPLLLAACARRRGHQPVTGGTHSDSKDWPRVTLIVSAYKEERTILQWIHNALLIDYPADRLEILVGCDGNEDATADLVRAVNDRRVTLLSFSQRRGKPSVLNDCAAIANGAILAFSDANSFYEPDALKKMVRHYSRPRVGGVVGELRLIDPHTGENVDGLYWHYENLLKRNEGRIGALLGANGAIYSLRKDLWQPVPTDTTIDDFIAGMRVHLARRELVYEPEALAREESAPTMQAEFERRARLGAGAYQSLAWFAPLLNPLRGTVAWAFWSHKVLRWFTPAFLAIAFVTNAILVYDTAFACLMALQAAAYSAAFAGTLITARSRGGRVLRLAAMFCSMNAALTVGFWRWLRKSQSGAWNRTVRTAELAQ